MTYPSWVTLANLGTYAQDYSFDLNPIIISFSAASGASVTVINGSLPAGLNWQRISNTINITGVAVPSDEIVSSKITFRISQSDGFISDRTYSLVLTPIPVTPSWTNQSLFLGYQGQSIANYQLLATPPDGDHITYSIVTPIAEASIDSNTGILTIDASLVGSNSTISVDVRATAIESGTISDVALSVDIIISPLAPTWITTPGSIGIFYTNEFVEFNMNAVDVTGEEVSYTLSSAPIDFPLLLSTSGLLYGEFVDPGVFSFTVDATSTNGTTSRTFSINIIPADLYNLVSWDTDSDLGTIDEGEIVEINLSATTDRRTTLRYYVTGGLLPPHLLLETSSGKIVGFCEYHAIDKIYYFDVMVSDGYQSITRQFKLTVNKKYNDQFFGANIPILGPLRDQWAADASNVKVRAPGTSVIYSISPLEDPPILNIINGIVTGYDTPDDIYIKSYNWLHNLDLQFGLVDNSSVQSNNVLVIYRNISDFQANANLTVYSDPVYNTNIQTNGTVYPINIENMRYALSKDKVFVNSGSGSNAIISPVLNWSTGGLDDIQIISSGAGFKSRPDITISGSGVDANVIALIGLVNVEIEDVGSGWSVGDIINIPGHIFESRAQVQVDTIGTGGSIASLSIVTPGNYNQVSSIQTTVINTPTATASLRCTWGIVGFDIINAGMNYQCGIDINLKGGEILPKWQTQYFPAIEIGKSIDSISNDIATTLNEEPTTLLGTSWRPNYIIFQWQGLTWLGSTTFDEDQTTFDGNMTQFEEVVSPKIIVFDNNLTFFDNNLTIFDYQDPLEYDLFQAWGGTLIDSGTTVFDLYTTVFDALKPKKYSNTMIRKWISLQHKIYSGNNAVW